MIRKLLLLGIALVLAAAAAVVLYRRRARSKGDEQRRGPLLKGRRSATADLLANLGNLSLMQVGHSRRLGENVGDSRRLHRFLYICETGFEHRRQTHTWLVAAYEADHGCSRATITAQEWLIATAWAASCRELPLVGTGDAAAGKSGPVAIVEDTDEWDARLRNGLSRWFREQPAERSWEIVPGYVVGYQTGRRPDEALADLGRAAEELGGMLKK